MSQRLAFGHPPDRRLDPSTSLRRYDSRVQTRYLILASLATGLFILAATALWFSTL
ncbi:MAG: hypothetical protein QNJ71_10785 [Acidimicrobiia bacterium]|nr:hypothetical protein [Acidimicrobiia bacterium]